MADISLSKAVRSNLLSLKGTADMMAATQNRLATGNKVNSALDNPSSWFTAKGLTNRASDLGALLDSMANGVKTLEAADNGLSAMTKTLESMQSTLRQARQDKSFQTSSYTMDTNVVSGDQISFSGGAVGSTAVDIDLASATSTKAGGAFTAIDFTNSGANDGSITFNVAANGGTATAVTIDYAQANAGAADASAVTAEELAAMINADLTAANVTNVSATVNGSGQIDFTSTSADESVADVTISGFAAANGATGSGITDGSGTDTLTAKTLDQLVSEINSNTDLTGKIRASNDNGKLRIENQSTQALTVDGVSSTGAIDGTSSGAATILGNSVRAGLADQFNELRDQLDKLADDASFNGINLLRGDKLAITFNETGTSSIDIQTENGDTINSANLGVSTTLEESDLDSDDAIDAELAKLKTALNDVRSQASTFGSNLSIVQNRQTFTEAMINTLEDGAGNLTLADMNTEAANLLALQTRQSLSQNSLSLASQADQSILQLIR
ncbi:flagellin [Devosia sp. XK-2]|uniref:flagellin N-terminal helical domain-containing protein n=1 Tax=Devosia sp. XK-2 TaxID=3126689 RepID=UPI0030D3F3C5